MINSYILRSGQAAVRRLCSLMQGILVVFLALEILYFVLSWRGSGTYRLVFMQMDFWPDGMTLDRLRYLSFEHRLIGIFLGLPALGMFFYAVVQFHSLLNYIKEGMIFATHTIATLQAFAGNLLLYMVLANLEKPLRAVILNALGANPKLVIVFSISGNELILVLVCTLFYILSAIMLEGRRLEEENKGFV